MLVLTPKVKLSRIERYVLNMSVQNTFEAPTTRCYNPYNTVTYPPLVTNMRVLPQSQWLIDPTNGILGTKPEKPVLKQYGTCTLCQLVYGYNYSQTQVHLIPLKWFSQKKNGATKLDSLTLTLCGDCATSFGLSNEYLFQQFKDDKQTYVDFHNALVARAKEWNDGTKGFMLSPGTLLGYSYSKEVDIPGQRALCKKVFQAGLIDHKPTTSN